MSDLLLTHGFFLAEDDKEQQIMRPYPPLGLLYLSAYLRRAGFDVEMFDTTFAARDDLYRRLAHGRGIVGIYANLITRPSVTEIIARAKSGGWTVVVGGPEPVNYPREYLRHGADVVVMGEGEATMEELLPLLARDGPHRLHGVQGTVFTDESGHVVVNPERPQIEDIDTIPWPDRDRIDTGRYVDVWREQHGMGSLNMITARGCPYRCRWCSHAVFGFTHRRRDPADCADELQHMVERYQPDQVWYADDVFTIHHRWLYRYADELRRRDLHLPFETISRADRMMKEQVLATLAEMGCRRIWIGAESGSQRILDAMERGVTVAQVLTAVRHAQRHGIEVGMFLMWGYEGETMEDIEATVRLVKEAAPTEFFTTVSYPIKNTAYYDVVADRVTAPDRWAAATDRDHEVSGRPRQAFYENATRLLRAEVAAAQSDDGEGARLREDARRARTAMEAMLREDAS